MLEHTNDGKTLHVKCTPMQWPMDNVPGECTYEWWIELDANQIHVRSRVINRRPNETQYSARDQELPAVYTNGPWYRLVTYLGDRPYEDGPLTVLTDKGNPAGFPWLRFNATEQWAALVDADDWGLGIYHPDTIHFAGGYAGQEEKKGVGGASDDQTGYVSPILKEILDHNIVYENRFVLVLGSVEEIRAYAIAQRRPAESLSFKFNDSRQHWRLIRATDQGFPVAGELVINASRAGGALVSPPMFWNAEDAPTLFVEAAFSSDSREAAVSFVPLTEDDKRGWDQWGPNTRRPAKLPEPVKFAVTGDGEMRVYRVQLSGHPEYRGAMLGLRLELPTTDRCRIRSIGFAVPDVK